MSTRVIAATITKRSSASGSAAKFSASPNPFAARCGGEPPSNEVIGHAKAEHRMGRNYLKGRDGDRINAVLAAAGYNFGLLLRWLARLLRALFQALFTAVSDPQPA